MFDHLKRDHEVETVVCEGQRRNCRLPEFDVRELRRFGRGSQFVDGTKLRRGRHDLDAVTGPRAYLQHVAADALRRGM